ncbi:MAG: 50S ribosomal protein L6 [Gammaproteobacteria bacterium]
MSRIANEPITIPDGVTFTLSGQDVTVKGGNGELKHQIHEDVSVSEDEGVVKVKANNPTKSAKALAGTTRALINNLVVGVSSGFERKLEIVGVGYRAQMKGKVLNLSLGFSHPIDFDVPEGVSIETPSQTEILIKGSDKQLVGQVAANIRAFRKPEPYKGKGVRYSDEQIIRKEAKKA